MNILIKCSICRRKFGKDQYNMRAIWEGRKPICRSCRKRLKEAGKKQSGIVFNSLSYIYQGRMLMQ